MLIKIAVLFLAVMLALALFGRLRGKPRRKDGTLARCGDCGRPVTGTRPCACQEGGR